MANNFHYLKGNLAKKPELARTATGIAVTTLRVAVNRSKKDGEEQIADWFNIVCWEKLAIGVVNRLKSGDYVVVEGRLQTRKYTDEATQQERTVTELVATDVLCSLRASQDEGEE